MKNNENVMAKFFAFTNENQIYQFEITKDNMIFCEQLGESFFSKIHIEPDFKVTTENGKTLSCREINKNNGSIGAILIANQVLEYCVKNGIISYCKKTAEEFNLEPSYAIENNNVEANIGKRRLLVPQK